MVGRKKADGHSTVADLVERIRLIRQVVSGDSQRDFAKQIGIDMKRWNNFERGYPVPYVIIKLLVDQLPGMSADWIMFGWHRNLSTDWKKRLRQCNGQKHLTQEGDHRVRR
jgi:DNA-binding XRE family transcriptional regulator